eukprot:GHVL01033714.1.p1 GENE.GHVL01033714.1~~GHVL01033714.1.p1  ORF type:complete len:265 (+),score=49.63 GHVL01033714.1:58-852(+)
MPIIGIIGGSGVEHIGEFLESSKKNILETPFGETCIETGIYKDIQIALLARHGKNHVYGPSNVLYRANIYAMKELGVTHIISATACGSLCEEKKPGDFVIVDQFIDRTFGRKQTFYDGSCDEFKGICHVSMGKAPFDSIMRDKLIETCIECSIEYHDKGCMVTIEGPRFSSLAESKMYRQWGGDLINMTTVPEVVLAKELGIGYSAVALVTDYDCWHDQEVSVPNVMKVMKSNAEKFFTLLTRAIPEMADLTPIKSAQECGAII